MACCESFSKLLLIIFNTLFFIIGAVILGVGIWVKVDKSNLFEMMRKVKLDGAADSFSGTNNSILDVIAIVLIILGAFTFVSGFCGCCGAIRESKCLLYTYCGLVTVVIIAEVGIGIYAGVEQNKFIAKLSDGLVSLVKNDFNGIMSKNASIFTKVLTSMMIDIKCCGINNEADFANTKVAWRQTIDSKPQIHPLGCCKLSNNFKYDPSKDFVYSDMKGNMVSPNCPTDDKPELNTNGCIPSILSLIKSNMAIVIGCCIGLGLFEILCIVFACCVARKDD